MEVNKNEIPNERLEAVFEPWIKRPRKKEKTKSYQDYTLTATRDNVFDGMRQLSLTVYFRTEPMLYYNREKKA